MDVCNSALISMCTYKALWLEVACGCVRMVIHGSVVRWLCLIDGCTRTLDIAANDGCCMNVQVTCDVGGCGMLASVIFFRKHAILKCFTVISIVFMYCLGAKNNVSKRSVLFRIHFSATPRCQFMFGLIGSG